MHWIDFKNAVELHDADNFTVLLLRLMFKADPCNLIRLASQWPVEAEMVKMYKSSDR